ncbi:MAG: hypothetical protein CFE25_03725 [Chitinophagaceae bacterium BSSC1]|nr:MAG: hypothetical protein CFE25_03725 [Chitinophagaceae bacterium BSSC1]
MRQFLVLLFLIIRSICYSQEDLIIKLAFSDKSNFDITQKFGHTRPKKYWVLNKTNSWNATRFHLEEDITNDSIRKELEQDEHSAYNNTYLFTDSILNQLFNESQKRHLFHLAEAKQPRQLIDTFKIFSLIPSFEKARNGFFFSISDPIFTQDKQYAFIDIVTHRKDNETEDLNSSYFGTTLLIFQHFRDKGWKRIKKVDRLIL